MDSKLLYGIPPGLFVVAFAVTITVLEVAKPKFVLAKKKSFMDEKKEVDHVKAVLYSLAIAAIVSIVYVVAVHATGKGYGMHAMAHSTMVIFAAFLLVYIVLAFVEPEFVLSDKTKELDMLKAAMIALSIAIVVGIVDYMAVSRLSKKGYIAPRASCFPAAGFGKQHYKMSFPADEDM